MESTLFDHMEQQRRRPIPEVQTPASKTSDPSTSREAEEAVTASGVRGQQQRCVLELVRRFPGRTALELSKLSKSFAWGPMDRYTINRRTSEIESTGAIKRGPKRKCTESPSGRRAEPWWPV